jgi:hypothetical protein
MAERRLGGGVPNYPERAVYNNALLDRDLGLTERAAAIDAMEAAFESAGVDRYAAWTHESDKAMRTELRGRGYTIAESTRAMGMSLDDVFPASPSWPASVTRMPMAPQFSAYFEKSGPSSCDR